MVHENAAVASRLGSSPKLSDAHDSHSFISGLFPSSAALFLSSTGQPDYSGQSSAAEGTTNSTNKFTSRLDANCDFCAKDVFDQFLECNRKYSWSDQLQSALSAIRPLGLLIQSQSCVVLLVHSLEDDSQSHLNTLKEFWLRGILTAPNHFTLDHFGELEGFEVNMVERWERQTAPNMKPTLTNQQRQQQRRAALGHVEPLQLQRHHYCQHPAVNSKIERIATCSSSLLSSLAFITTVTELICLSIVSLTEQNKPTSKGAILQYIRECEEMVRNCDVTCAANGGGTGNQYSSSSLFLSDSKDLIYTALENLVKEKKVLLNSQNQQYYISSTQTHFHQPPSTSTTTATHAHALSQQLQLPCNANVMTCHEKAAVQNPNPSCDDTAANCTTNKSIPTIQVVAPNRPLSFVNQHAGVSKENNKLVYSGKENNAANYTANILRATENNGANKPTTHGELSPSFVATKGSYEKCANNGRSRFSQTATPVAVESASESDVPRNCVQSVSKLLARYRNSSASKRATKNLITFNAQFPPDDVLAHVDMKDVAISGSDVDRNLCSHSANVYQSIYSDVCCNKDIYAVIKQLQVAHATLAQKQGWQAVSPMSPQSNKIIDFIQAEEINRSYLMPNRKCVSSRKSSGQGHRKSRNYSPKFVAYLPDDCTAGSDSIIKCPINTPTWARDSGYYDMWSRSSRHRNHNFTPTHRPSKIDFSHHNYFHRHSRRHRRTRASMYHYYSPSYFTTSDEACKKIAHNNGDVEISRMISSSMVRNSTNRTFNCRAPRRRVMSSDDSVFSYYSRKHELKQERQKTSSSILNEHSCSAVKNGANNLHSIKVNASKDTNLSKLELLLEPLENTSSKTVFNDRQNGKTENSSLGSPRKPSLDALQGDSAVKTS